MSDPYWMDYLPEEAKVDARADMKPQAPATGGDAVERIQQRIAAFDMLSAEAAALANHSPDAGGVGEAAADVIAERERQVQKERWTPEHDDEHGDGSLAAAAAAYAFSAATADRYFAADPVGFWPWDVDSWKPKTPREDLVRAGALILAEIERLDRATRPCPSEGEE